MMIKTINLTMNDSDILIRVFFSFSFIFLDAIHYKVRDEKRIVTKAAYIALGVNMDGEKEATA